MRLVLLVAGSVVVGCALVRAAHLGQRQLWVRMSMVISWAILAAGVTLLQIDDTDEGTLLVKATFAVGILLGAGSFAASRLTHGARD